MTRAPPPPAHQYAPKLRLATQQLPSRISALLALPRNEVLVGTADGALLLFDMWREACPLVARTIATARAPITQLVPDPSWAVIYVLQGGAVLYMVASPLVQLPSENPSACPELTQLVPLPPVEGEDVCCVAAAWSRRVGSRLCCASCDGSLHVFGFVGGPDGGEQQPARPELLVRVRLALPPGFESVRSMAWGGIDDALLISDGRRVAHVQPLPWCDRPWRGDSGHTMSATPFAASPLAAPGFDQGGGRATAVALPSGEMLVVGAQRTAAGGGGGVGGAAVVVDASEIAVGMVGGPLHLNPAAVVGGVVGSALPAAVQQAAAPLSRPPLLLDGRSTPAAVAVAWPYLLTCSHAHLRVYDVAEGSHVQSLSLPASFAAGDEDEAAGANGGPPPVLMAACGPHMVAVGIGRALYQVPCAAAGMLAREAEWLDRLSVRTWDATLVERHMTRELGAADGADDMIDVSAGSAAAAANATGGSKTGHTHPLARAITRLAEGFARDGPRIATAADSGGVLDLGLEAAGLSGGLALGPMRGSVTIEGCASACHVARRSVGRVALEAIMMYPQLAPRSPDEAAHGAAGTELLRLVEHTAYGALRRTLVGLHAEVALETTRRYQQQLRLLSRLTPERLGLPAAFCVRPKPLVVASARFDAPQAKGAEQPYAEAVLRLQQLPRATTPERGLQCLVDVCHLVADGAEELGAPPPSADELVPLIAYVCTVSQVASLPVELSLLQDLAADSQLSGESGYSLATFQVALRWLMQLRWDELHFESHAVNNHGGGCQHSGATHSTSGHGTAAHNPTHAARGRSAASRRAGGQRQRPAPPTRAHPAIADSIELLRALEAELPERGSMESPAGPSPAGQAQAGFAAHAKDGLGVARLWPEDAASASEPIDTGQRAHIATELRESSVRDLLAEARRLTLDASSCVEKQELLDLLLAHRRASRQGSDGGVGEDRNTCPSPRPRPSQPAPPEAPLPPSRGVQSSASGNGMTTVATPPTPPTPTRRRPMASCDVDPAAHGIPPLSANGVDHVDRRPTVSAVEEQSCHETGGTIPAKRLPRMGARARRGQPQMIV